jgi:hypothetical protein
LLVTCTGHINPLFFLPPEKCDLYSIDINGWYYSENADTCNLEVCGLSLCISLFGHDKTNL